MSDKELEQTPEAKRAEREKETAEMAVQGEKGIAALDKVGASELMAFTPETYADAWRLADAVSKSGIVNNELRGNPGAVLAVMQSGQSMGVGWGTAVQLAHVVKGRVGWPASLLDAVCDSDSEFEYFEVIECDNKHAVVEAKKHRWDKPRRHEVTIQDAEAMGFLDGKHSQLWMSKRPMPMLVAMVRREAARLWNTKRLAGLHTPDELMFDKPAEKNVTQLVTAEDLPQANPLPVLKEKAPALGGQQAGLPLGQGSGLEKIHDRLKFLGLKVSDLMKGMKGLGQMADSGLQDLDAPKLEAAWNWLDKQTKRRE